MFNIPKYLTILTQWVQRQPQTFFTCFRRKHRRSYYILGAGLCSFAIAACTTLSQSELNTTHSSPAASQTLTIWWEKGFNLEEDEALQKVVTDWQQHSGRKAELSFYTTDDLLQRAQRAQQAGNPPDILMSHNAERGLYPYLAWQGELVDVSDVVAPVEAQYPASILATVNLYNNREKKRSYYAVPLSQTTTFISYWRDLIQQAGYSDRDIPQNWSDFWIFWQQVQDKLAQPQTQSSKIYGLGFSFSDKAADTYLFFEQVLEAYDAQLLTPEGELRLDDPAIRQKIIESLKWYTQFYQQGYVPPETVKWLNPDNNSHLLNRSVVMTPNTSLTIPATVRQDEAVYQQQLGTLEFPSKLNGKPMRYILTIKQAVIFTESKNQAIAKEFLAYLIQPQVLNSYLKAAGIRNMPVTQPLWQDPYWTNPDDPHISIGAKVLNSEHTRPFPSVYHPAYSLVAQENVWGKAINQIVVEKVPVEKAADNAIARIKQIFQQWR